MADEHGLLSGLTEYDAIVVGAGPNDVRTSRGAPHADLDAELAELTASEGSPTPR